MQILWNYDINNTLMFVFILHIQKKQFIGYSLSQQIFLEQYVGAGAVGTRAWSKAAKHTVSAGL